MRAYVRTSRRTGISLPFWLVPFAALLWATVMVAYWTGLVIVATAILIGRLTVKGWEAWKGRRES